MNPPLSSPFIIGGRFPAAFLIFISEGETSLYYNYHEENVVVPPGAWRMMKPAKPSRTTLHSLADLESTEVLSQQ
jgi:hypothetical protein